MKILHLVNHLHNCGNGIVNVVVDLAIEQRRSGHEVIVASSGGDFTALLEANDVRHLTLPQTSKHSLSALGHLILLVRREHIDIVHAHMMAGALIARLATTFTQTKVVTTIHNAWQRHAFLMKFGHCVIAVSDAVKQEMIGRGIPARKLYVVLNGTLGSLRNSAMVDHELVVFQHPAVLTVSGLYVRKGISDLIEATTLLRKHIPEVKVYIAGKGPDGALFERQVRTLELSENIIFLGFRSDVTNLLQQADVFVLASHADPNPLVISEARIAGVPVVATAVDGIPESLEQGRAGVLVPPHSPPAIADALRKILCNPLLQEQLRQAGSQNLELMQVRRVSDETLNVYKKALGMAI